MVVDFTVKNFRSIRDEYSLSMYAEKSVEHLPGNIFCAGGDINVLRSAGVYGANASGKSNVLLAFNALVYLINFSDKNKDGEEISCFEPYKLDGHSAEEPIFFEIEFYSQSQTRFLYKVAFNAKKVTYESLFYYPSAKQALLFERSSDDTWESVKFGAYLKGGKKRIAFFDSNLYLSKAGNSADSPEILREAYDYLRKNIKYYGVRRWDKMPIYPLDVDLDRVAEKVYALLAYSDTGIVSFEIKERDIDPDALNLPSHVTEKIKQSILHSLKRRPVFKHEGNENVSFEMEEESAGTQKLFKMAPVLFGVLENGGVLVVDELDNSLHPDIAELIVRLFNDPEVNKGNGQLIFSTHNVSLMNSSLFRREQVWFTEKDNGATRLFSLDDFDKKQVRHNSPFEKWYSEGRFGALPQVDYYSIAEKIKGGAQD